MRSLALVSVLIVSLQGCSGGGTIATDRLDGLDSVVSTENYNLTDSGSAAVSELLTYRMPGVNGDVVEATAALLIPQGPPPETGFPVIAWGHGTTGVADRCAPSATANLAGYASYLDLYLQNGYAVVAPDYEGLGADGPHPYLHLASEGRSLIYAVKAAVQQYPVLSSRFVAIGHSQGGHAALGAGEYARELSDVSLAGVVAIAPASNLREQSEWLRAIVNDQSRSNADRVQAGVTQLLYSALVLNGVSAVYPDFETSNVYGSNGDALLDSLESQCTSGLSDILLNAVTGTLFISGSTESIISSEAINLPLVSQYLAENEPASRPTSAPIMLLQGLLDETVLAQSTNKLSNLLLQTNGSSPVLTEYPTADHGSIVAISAPTIINFLADLF